MPLNRRVTLASRPAGSLKESDFAADEAPVPEPGTGEVLVRALYVSVDPYQRGRLSDRRSYARPVELGGVITSGTVGEVVESNDPRFSPGDVVVGQLGWQEYAVERAGALREVDRDVAPVSMALHVLGMTGFTAYFGLLDVGRPRPGDTVVVSAASGAVGQVVGQLARLSGCRTVGLAGTPEKVDDLRELYGYDAAIDYRRDDLGAALKEACPNGVDLYFDNVGGELSDAVHRRLALGARIVICGQIAQYDTDTPAAGARDIGFLIGFRARMEGFLVFDYAHRYAEAYGRLARWVADGSIRYREDVVDGLENAPRALIGMLHGENRGKQLVRVTRAE